MHACMYDHLCICRVDQYQNSGNTASLLDLLACFPVYVIKIHVSIPDPLAPSKERLSNSSTLLKPILKVFARKPKLPGLFEPQRKDLLLSNSTGSTNKVS